MTNASPTPVPECIRVLGAHQHNLATVDVEIPKRSMTVVTGVSGSGKSSLVFDTIAMEGQRQFNETLPAFVRAFLPGAARPAVDLIEHLPATISIDQRALTGGPRSTVGTITDIAPLLRQLFARAGEPFVGYADTFSFNLPAGMCPRCDGIGEVTDIDMAAFLDPARSLRDGALLAPTFKTGSHDLHLLVASGRFDVTKPVAQYTKDELDELLYGDSGTVPLEVGDRRINMTYEGAVLKFRRRYLESDTSAKTKQMVARFTTTVQCPDCHGARLSPLALTCHVNGYDIAQLSAMEVEELLGLLRTFDLPQVKPIVDALVRQVGHLVHIGLGYLSLDRRTSSLSGGEAQRVKFVRHLSSSLNDLLYVFDEPSIGLHPRDVHRLTNLLHTLRDKGNTVLVVEHDRDLINAADHVVDIGPGAGNAGGRVVFTGSPSALAAADTPTGRCMTGRTTLKPGVRTATGTLAVEHAGAHNLRDVSVDIPAGVFTAICGVAGAGKSSLVMGGFAAQHQNALVIDQSAPHANRRSTVITYTGVADRIRAEFARANNVGTALFSANSAGACPTCQGLGVVETDIPGMETVSLVCQTCDGHRFNDDVLAYRLRGRTISDVLDMTVAQGREFFAGNRKIRPVLTAAGDVGLDYLRLGQPLTSLSGGECQRIKLAAALHARNSIYVLDEPTVGLHMADVARLLAMLDRLVDDYAATVLVIEHNLDVIAHADWVVELGPEGGTRGGQVLFQGTPRDLTNANTATGNHLRRAVAD